jgi:hypothetical protein
MCSRHALGTPSLPYLTPVATEPVITLDGDRAHWRHFDSEEERTIYAPRVVAAQEGMLLLASAPRTSLSPLRPADWGFLLSLTNGALAAQWQAAAAAEAQDGPPRADGEAGPFTLDRFGARRVMNEFVTGILGRVDAHLCRDCAEPVADARAKPVDNREPLGGGPWAAAELAEIFGTALYQITS